jgi:hypothetical protein
VRFGQLIGFLAIVMSLYKKYSRKQKILITASGKSNLENDDN